MRADPVLEWRRLTEHYRQMSEGELRELADAFSDLTETAQQALRGEFHSRGLGDPAVPESRPVPTDPDLAPLVLRNAPSAGSTMGDVAFDPFPTPEPVPDTPDVPDDDAGPHEYTWKTVLCECDEPVQAQLLAAALNRAGIECWIENQGTRSRYTGMGLNSPRVLVAADQLDQARMIAAKPIPHDIVAESKAPPTEFQMPRCPRCRAADPDLVDANPENTWRCEQCGREWTEADQNPEADVPESAQNRS